NENGEYVHGPLFPCSYGILMLLCILGITYIHYHRRDLDKRQKVAAWLFVVFIAVGGILQGVFFQKTLLTMYMASLAVLVFMFAVETPDYHRLKETLKELSEARAQSDENARRADIANKSKSRFLANMSHEIRTPINAVIGMNEMVLRQEKDPKIKSYAMDVKRSADSLLSIINDILDLSKIESGKMELAPADYDVSSLIHDVINMVSQRAADKELKLELSIDTEIPSRLYGDDVRLRQIMVNLLNNAVKYTEKGYVSFEVKLTGIEEKLSRLLVKVSDSGIGIRKEDMEKLFADYERLDEEKNRNNEGTGLGMSITRQLLEMMGSELKVESTYGVGSVFSFEVEQRITDETPIGNLEARIREQASEYSYEASFQAPEASILLVDDNTINRRVFVSLLSDTGVNIDEAAGGNECLEKVREKHYDMIFLDHMMPDLDGMETLKIMQEGGHKNEDTPVIALTANAINGAREMYLEAGFTDFLAKPVRADKLEKLLYDMLPRELVKQTEDNEGTEDFPTIDGVDFSYAISYMHDEKLLRDTASELALMYREEAKKLDEIYGQGKAIDEAETPIEEQLRLYRVQAHSMKTAAAMIGAMTVSSLAKLLEYAARDGDIDTIRSIHPIFIKQWNRLGEDLSETFLTEEGSGNRAFDDEDEEAVKDMLKKLSEAMEEYDVTAADEIIENLQHYGFPDELQADFAGLCGAVRSLDSEETDEYCKRILDNLSYRDKK
ncbi:MAG: response regulator, partial [Lachnospiraceae bacterium]|nr:response regulator [Lachnospiraceae bacterium]